MLFPASPPQLQGGKPAPPRPSATTPQSAVLDVAQKLLLEDFAPPCVFIDAGGEILYTHGKTGKYLEFVAPGHANLNVLEMARQGIRHELASGSSESKIARKAYLRRRSPGQDQRRVPAAYLDRRTSAQVEGIGELLMVVFEDMAPKQLKSGKAKIALTPTARHRIAQLEQELKYSQEHLQTTIEELATSNEELKSSNGRELQSTNEELCQAPTKN